LVYCLDYNSQDEERCEGSFVVTLKRPTVDEIYEADRDKDSQLEYERAFFNRVRLHNGVYKTTYNKRFDDLNPILIKIIDNDKKLSVMDVAISAGVSTLELSEDLNLSEIEHTIVASDYCIDATQYYFGKKVSVLLDKYGNFLQADLFGRSVTNHSYNIVSTISKVFIKLVLLSLRKMFSVIGLFRENEGALFRKKKVQLVSKLLATNDKIKIIEDDVTDAELKFDEDSFDLIRAANIINLQYFPEEKLLIALNKLIKLLKADGVLCICRTSVKTGKNNSSVYRKISNKELELVEKLRDGSEIDPLLDKTYIVTE